MFLNEVTNYRDVLSNWTLVKIFLTSSKAKVPYAGVFALKIWMISLVDVILKLLGMGRLNH